MHETLKSSALEKKTCTKYLTWKPLGFGVWVGDKYITNLGGGFNYFFSFTPNYLGKWSNLNHVFQVCWFNHQLAKHVALLFRVALGVVKVFGWLSSKIMYYMIEFLDGTWEHGPRFFWTKWLTTEPSESRYVSRKWLLLRSSSEDGIGTLNSILGRGLDS